MNVAIDVLNVCYK